jgi:6-phosphogluconolactonase (cycloisomerase 2 family)
VATANPVPFAGATTLTPTFSGGIGNVDQAVGTVSSGTAFSSGTITASKTFTLTVTNAAGTTARASVTLTPTAVSVGALSPAAPTRTVGTSTPFSATATGGTTNTLTWTASAGTMVASTGAWMAPATNQTVTITATSVDDPTKAATTTVTVVAAPVQPTITVVPYVTAGQGGYTASISSQAGCTYAWTITNGSIASGTTAASISFSAGATGTVTLSCTVTNAAGTASAAGTATSTIVPFPAISLIAASPADVASGAASTLSYAFSGGTGAINQGVGAVISGGTTVVHPLSTTTYTLTVTSPAGVTTTDTVTVTVGAPPSISAFQASSSTITVGQGTLLSFTFTGDGAINQGVGAVTSGSQIAVSPAVTTIYTLTATNAVGATTTATVTVTVKAYTGKFVYVANAGGGVSGFSLNDGTGLLTELGNSPFDDGVEALHVTSDPQGKFLFVVNGDGQANLANTLTVFQINQSTGDLTKVSTYPTGSKPWASAVDPSGRFVYVRCDGVISAFSLNGTTGALLPLGTSTITTTGGTGEVLVHPSGQYLFTVGRSSDQLQVFNLNPATGGLSLNSSYGMATGTGPLALALSHSGEYLFTKSEGAPGGAAQECVVYGFYLDVQTGGLTPLAGTSTGLQQADAYHGVSGNPTQPVIYITLATSDNDYAAYALNLVTGQLSALSGSTYDLFGGTGSDSLVVSRKGDWGFMTDYTGGRIAVGAVDPTTGVLTSPTFVDVGLFPVSVTVVGTVH